MEAYDFQRPYLRMVLGFIGLTDVAEVLVEPTMQGGPEAAREALQRAVEQARVAAREMAGKL
jgi:FMN-dependent NADH-azoreductase